MDEPLRLCISASLRWDSVAWRAKFHTMEPWTFIHVADIQPGSPKSYRHDPSWIRNWYEAKEQILEIKPDLLLVGGDLTRDGSIHRYELEEMKGELASLPFPVHVVPGNMDTGNKHTLLSGRHRGPDQCSDVELNVTSAQLQQFAWVFGPLWWSTDHKNVRFSGFADVVVNSGLPEESEFWAWAESQKRRAPQRAMCGSCTTRSLSKRSTSRTGM